MGAGLSGLSAIRELQKAGIPTLGIEARDRIGGRAHQLRTDLGRVFEAGGEFVKPGHGRVLALLEEFGIDTLPVGQADGSNVIIQDGARWLERTPFDSDTFPSIQICTLRGMFARLADAVACRGGRPGWNGNVKASLIGLPKTPQIG